MSESGPMGPEGHRPHPGATPGNDDKARAETAVAKRRRSRKKRRQHGATGAAHGTQAARAANPGRDVSGSEKAGDPARERCGGKRRGKKRHRPNRAERRAQATQPDRGGMAPDAGTPAIPHPANSAGAERAQTARSGGTAVTQDRREQTGKVPAGDMRGAPEASSPERASRPVGPARHGGAGGAILRPFRERSGGEGGECLPNRLYAALDLGTNNCRLLVARPEQRGFRVVDAYSRIVRLGEGLGHANRLSDAAMERALEALVCCRDKMRDRGVERSRLIATEACRAAENGPQFIERVRQETGMALEIASRETEARLAVAGCASLVDPDANGVVLFDIGGGSSEIVWLDLRNRCGARGVALTRFIRAWVSLPVGVVNLAERHGGRHVTTDTFEAMVDDARAHLEAFTLGRELSAAICDGKVHMLGTSGTVTTLAGVHFGLKRYDRRRVDGAWMDNEDVTAMIERLRAMPYEERVGNPCIGADRADLVLAGCAILESIRRRWPCQRLRVADRGLREGILMELMAADNVWRRNAPPRHRGRARKQQ